MWEGGSATAPQWGGVSGTLPPRFDGFRMVVSWRITRSTPAELAVKRKTIHVPERSRGVRNLPGTERPPLWSYSERLDAADDQVSSLSFHTSSP